MLLHDKLRDSGYQTSIADMKVRIATQAGAINHFLNGAMQLNALHEFVGRYLDICWIASQLLETHLNDHIDI